MMANDLQRDVLKGTRWMLLKGQENLDDNRNEKKRLQDALELNRPTANTNYIASNKCAVTLIMNHISN